jgi:hypothetical protein
VGAKAARRSSPTPAKKVSTKKPSATKALVKKTSMKIEAKPVTRPAAAQSVRVVPTAIGGRGLPSDVEQLQRPTPVRSAPPPLSRSSEGRPAEARSGDARPAEAQRQGEADSTPPALPVPIASFTF